MTEKTVECKYFNRLEFEDNHPLIVSFSKVKEYLGNKSLGYLHCVVSHPNLLPTPRILGILSISGLGGKESDRCLEILRQLKEEGCLPSETIISEQYFNQSIYCPINDNNNNNNDNKNVTNTTSTTVTSYTGGKRVVTTTTTTITTVITTVTSDTATDNNTVTPPTAIATATATVTTEDRFTMSLINMMKKVFNEGFTSENSLRTLKEVLKDTALASRLSDNEDRWFTLYFFFNEFYDFHDNEEELTTHVSRLIDLFQNGIQQFRSYYPIEYDIIQQEKANGKDENALIAKAMELALAHIGNPANLSNKQQKIGNAFSQSLLASIDKNFDFHRISGIIDILSQCAEENASIRLMDWLRSSLGYPLSECSITVTWYSTCRDPISGEQIHKDLCEFCQKSRFKERLVNILNTTL